MKVDKRKFNLEALQDIKINARALQRQLLPECGKISYQTCLHTLAKKYGFSNWHEASAYAKKNEIIILDANQDSFKEDV